MKKQIKITLILDVEIDGVPSEGADIADAIGIEIVESIPRVLCGCDEYCVLVDDALLDTAEELK